MIAAAPSPSRTHIHGAAHPTNHTSSSLKLSSSYNSTSSHKLASPKPTSHHKPTVFGLLAGHNRVRASHGARPLVWSASLAEMAGRWANRCEFQHTYGILSSKPYGENIAAATGNFTPEAAVKLFVQDQCTDISQCEIFHADEDNSTIQTSTWDIQPFHTSRVEKYHQPRLCGLQLQQYFRSQARHRDALRLFI